MVVLTYDGENASEADFNVNLLNPPSPEELGKAILNKLMNVKSKKPYLELNGTKLTTRQVVIHGS